MLHFFTRFLALCLALSLAYTSFAQVIFDKNPGNKMFLPQNKKLAGCIYKVSGTVTDFSFTNLFLDVYKSGRLIQSNETKLRKINQQLRFDIAAFIPTKKSFYKLVFRLTGARTDSLIVDSVLVGDVYLIQGQSNAVAANFSNIPRTEFDSIYSSPFIRSFGTSSSNWFLSQNEVGWYEAQGIRTYYQGAVGQWAMVMANALVDSFDTPICMLNGAVGGTPVNFHLPDTANPFNPLTNYGRLLTRTENAGIRENITGIFYFQGESDGVRAVKHDTMFRTIVDAWKRDFPDFQKLYVIQVREGCGSPSLELREVQRQFGLTIDRCQTVSANGLNGHDGCHYKLNEGYADLGIQLAHLVGRDRYNSGLDNVDPPDISKAIYFNKEHTEVRLIMQHEQDSVFVDQDFEQLFGITGDPNIQIVSGRLEENQVILRLNKPSCSDISLFYNGARGRQKWVKNKTGMGLLSFYNVPILPYDLDTHLFACKNQDTRLGADSISGYSYHWVNLTSKVEYTQANPLVKLDASTKFRLTMDYGGLNCLQSDTVIIAITVDSTSLPKFRDKYVFCEADSIIIEPENSGYKRFEWNLEEGWRYALDTTEATKWKGESLSGCVYLDSFCTRVSFIDINEPEDILICSGQDTLLTIQDSFERYFWNDTEGENSYTASAGNLKLVVQNSDRCEDSIVFNLVAHPKQFNPSWTFEVCEDEELQLVKPEEMEQWFFKNKLMNDTIRVLSESKTVITWKDNLGCYFEDTLVRIDLKKPNAILGDTGICEGESIYINLDDSFHYVWSDGVLNSSRTIDRSGLYNVTLTDKNGCSTVEEFNVESWSTPSLNMFKDTVLCKDSSWLVLLQNNVNYWVNSVLVNDSIKLYAGNVYNILSQNLEGCESTLNINVDAKNCVLGMLMQENQEFIVYPIPATKELKIESFNKKISQVSLYDSRGQMVVEKLLNPHFLQLIKLDSLKGIYLMHVEFVDGTYKMQRICVK